MQQNRKFFLHSKKSFLTTVNVGAMLKATDDLQQFELQDEELLSFTITREDFNLWMGSVYPVFLILYDAQAKRAYWQYVQAFFAAHPPKKSATKTLQLHIPKKNILRKRTIQLMRKKKANVLEKTSELKHE